MKKKKTSLRKIGSLICFIIMAIFITLTLKSIVKADDNNSGDFELFGCRPVIVVSGSMEPAIAVNSVSIMQYCTIDDIEIGDVVMYRHPSLRINITHRVIEKNTDEIGTEYLVTKGDANESQDKLKITNDLVVGKLTKTYNDVAPYISFVMLENGEVNTFALIQIILLLAVVITILGMLMYLIWIIISTVFIVLSGSSKLNSIVTEYNSNIELQQEIAPVVNNIGFKKGDTIRVILAKIILARELRAVEESIKDIEKAYKIASKIGGEQFNSKE